MSIGLRALLCGCLGIFVADDVASLALLCFPLLHGGEAYWNLQGLGMLVLIAHLFRLALISRMLIHIISFKRGFDRGLWEVCLMVVLALPVLVALLVAFFWHNLTSQLPTMSITTTVSFLLSWTYVPLLWSASKDAGGHSETTGRADASIVHRLNVARFALLTRRTFNAKEEDPEVGDPQHCSICLSEFNVEEKLLQLTCGHTYHESCITHWFFPGAIPYARQCPLRCEAVLAAGVLVAEDEHTVAV